VSGKIKRNRKRKKMIYVEFLRTEEKTIIAELNTC